MVRRPSAFQNIIGDWHQYIGQLAIERHWNMGGPTICRPEWISNALHYAKQHPEIKQNWHALCRAHFEYWDETLYQDLMGGRINWKSNAMAEAPVPSWLEDTEFASLHALPGPRILFATLAYLDMAQRPCPSTVEHANQTLYALFPDWLDRVRAMYTVWLNFHDLPSSKLDEKERLLEFEQILSAPHLSASILYPTLGFDTLE